ncbi:MAG TPA: hypothetical protein VL737_00475 [Candidatus Pristimantibacillus sp.]|nr:hypothetical protein [Candidatus Pristimantibacillus sp.]
MASLLEKVARPDEIGIADRVTEGWNAVNYLIQHLDNRADGDYPNSGKPPDEPSDADLKLSGYFLFLAFPGTFPDLPDDDGYLTPEQREAFAAMRTHFDDPEFTDGSASAFSAALQSWLQFSKRSKQAARLPDYLRYRRLEGMALGELFALSVPPSARKEHFPAFMRRLSRIGKIAKLVDSTIDLNKDRASGNVNSQLPGTTRATTALLASYEATKFLAGNLRLFRPLGQKALAFVKNRSGSRNQERING